MLSCQRAEITVLDYFGYIIFHSYVRVVVVVVVVKVSVVAIIIIIGVCLLFVCVCMRVCVFAAERETTGFGGSHDHGDPKTTNLYVGNLSPQVSVLY